MTDIKKQRVERCVKCSKCTEMDFFDKELSCPLYFLPCSEIVQCMYVADNKRYE